MARRETFCVLWLAAALAISLGLGADSRMPRIAVVIGCLIMADLKLWRVEDKDD